MGNPRGKIATGAVFYLLFFGLINQFNLVFAEGTKQQASISGVVALGSYEEALGREVGGLVMIFDKNPQFYLKHFNLVPAPIVMTTVVAKNSDGIPIEHPILDYSRESRYSVANLQPGKRYYVICFPVFGMRLYCFAPELNLGSIPIKLTKNKTGVNIRFYSYSKLSEVPRITVTNISKIFSDGVNQSDINIAPERKLFSSIENASISGKVTLDKNLVSADTVLLVMAFETEALKGLRNFPQLFSLPNIPIPAAITVADSRSGKYTLNGLIVGKNYFVCSLLALQEEKNYLGQKVASVFLNDNVPEVNFRFGGQLKKASISGKVLKEPGISCNAATDIMIFDTYPRYVGNRIPKPVKELKITNNEEYIISDLPTNKTYYIIARNIQNGLIGGYGITKDGGMELTPINFDKERKGINIHLYRRRATDASSLSDEKELARILLRVASISGVISVGQEGFRGGVATIAVFEEHPSRATGIHQNYFTEIKIPSPGIGNYAIHGLPTGRKYYIVARHKGIERETGYGILGNDGYLKLAPIELNSDLAEINLEFN